MRRLLVLCCGAALASCGSSPTAPSSTTGATSSLTISGAAALGVGQTAQLSAATNQGQAIAGATWVTSNETVARVSTTGLITAIGKGTAEIKATYQGVHGTLTVIVSLVLISSPTITSCGSILTPGAYVLGTDISQAANGCLSILANAVELDCRGHSVTGVSVTNASDVSITNCTIPGGPGSYASVTSSSNVTFDHNAMAASFALVNGSTNVTFQYNTVMVIELKGGGNNRIIQNTFDGGYDGSGKQVGADDGIVLFYEANDLIQDNTIRNVFDAGIEGADSVVNTMITNNTIINAGVAGISSYWCTSWTGNTISGNNVSRSESLVDFYYAVSIKCGSPAAAGAFANNQIVSNRFSSPVGPGGSPMYFNFPQLASGAVVNNLIQGNDLGSAQGPLTVPSFGFINGGGNICGDITNPYCHGLNALLSGVSSAYGAASIDSASLFRVRSDRGTPRYRLGPRFGPGSSR